MTTGKTVVHINLGERQVEDIQRIDVIVTTKDNTRILYDKWYMTEQEPTVQAVPIEVLQDIRQEITNLVKTYPFIDHKDSYVKETEVLEIIDKYKAEEGD